METRNPATDEVLGSVTCVGPEQVARAIDSAATAQPDWGRRAIETRCECLLALVRQLLRRRERLARVAALETGFSVSVALAELDASVRSIRDLVELASRERWRFPRPGAHRVASTCREPVGVVAIVTSAVEPVLAPARRLAAALVSGNGVVLAPAVQASWSAELLIQACIAAGVPAGVLQLVTGPYQTVAQMLIGDVQVAALSYCGAALRGIELHRYAVSRGARVQCELAGNNGALVGVSADPAVTAAAIVALGFGRAGQLCCAPRRLIVPHACADELVGRLLECVQSRGGKDDPDPLPDPRARDALLQYIDLGRRDGARLLCGGTVAADSDLRVQPALIDGVEASMRIAQELVPGPLLRVLRVGSFEHGVAVLNGVERQTSAWLFSSDAEEQAAFADRAEAPLRQINAMADALAVGALPLVTSSGIAPPQADRSPLDFYTRTAWLYD